MERRLRADCGDGWMLSSHTRRLLAEAVDFGMGEAFLHWRDYVDHPEGFRRISRRATDKAKTWLAREKARRGFEEQSVFNTMTLAGAMYGRVEMVMPGAHVPVLVQLDLEQLRRLVAALDKPERLVVEARYWHGKAGSNLPWRDVARTVGHSMRTVRATHTRALDELRSWMT